MISRRTIKLKPGLGLRMATAQRELLEKRKAKKRANPSAVRVQRAERETKEAGPGPSGLNKAGRQAGGVAVAKEGQVQTAPQGQIYEVSGNYWDP